MPDAREQEVHLAVPATPELLRLARVTASGLASRLGFTYDEVQDLRLAIEELCFALVGNGQAGGMLRLRYTVLSEALEVEGQAYLGPAADGGAPRLTELSERILDALVDEHSLDDGPRFRLVKRRLL